MNNLGAFLAISQQTLQFEQLKCVNLPLCIKIAHWLVCLLLLALS